MSLNNQQSRLDLIRDRYPDFPEIKAFIEAIKREDPLLVLLFGSLATGEFTQYSDADVLTVFAKQTSWDEVYSYSSGVVQPVVKSIDEALHEIGAGNTFLIEAIEDGIVLFDTNDTYARLIYTARQAKQKFGLVRDSRGWRWEK